MKRIQIVISAEWPDGEKLDDHICRGAIAGVMKNIPGAIITVAGQAVAIGEPEIIETRAPRADKGTTRRKNSPLVAIGDPTPVAAVLAAPAEAMPDIPEFMRRQAN